MSRRYRSSLARQTIALANKYPPGAEVLVAPTMDRGKVLGYHLVTDRGYTRMQLFVSVNDDFKTVRDEECALIYKPKSEHDD